MVKYQQRELDNVFSSLTDPTRRDILRRLTEKQRTVSEIASSYPISLPAVTKHLHQLERARLIRKRKHGRERLVTLNPQPLAKALRYLQFYTAFWNKQLDSLESYINNTKRKERENDE